MKNDADFFETVLPSQERRDVVVVEKPDGNLTLPLADPCRHLSIEGNLLDAANAGCGEDPAIFSEVNTEQAGNITGKKRVISTAVNDGRDRFPEFSPE